MSGHAEIDEMEPGYDFSKGERGKFYHPDTVLHVPVYLDADVDEIATSIRRTMDNTMTAVEVTVRIDEQHRLQLDKPLPISGPRRVRVIVLYATEEDIDESVWLSVAVGNPAFDFLKDPAEDVYSATDGIPLRHKT